MIKHHFLFRICGGLLLSMLVVLRLTSWGRRWREAVTGSGGRRCATAVTAAGLPVRFHGTGCFRTCQDKDSSIKATGRQKQAGRFVSWTVPQTSSRLLLNTHNKTAERQTKRVIGSKTHKRLKERFLIRRNRTKRANFRCNPLFQATYNTTENS